MNSPPLPLSLPIVITLILTTIIPPTTPWTLTLRNSSTTSGTTIIHQTTPQPCTPIHHQKGYEFSFDPEGTWCLDFWHESTCNTRIGWSCDGQVWRKVASQNISGFDIYVMPGVSSSTSTNIFPSGNATRIEAPTTTGTIPPQQGSNNISANPESASGSKISGGAIAGIIVGVVAGVAVLGVLWRRWGRKLVGPSGDGQGRGGSSRLGYDGRQVPIASAVGGLGAGQMPVVREGGALSAELDADTGSGSGSGVKMAEVLGQGVSAELGGCEVVELDGRGYERRDG